MDTLVIVVGIITLMAAIAVVADFTKREIEAIKGLPDDSKVLVRSSHWTDEADPDGMMLEEDAEALEAVPDHAKATLIITV